MAVICTIELKPAWEVIRKVRGARIPSGRTIESVRDKARRKERQDFRQNWRKSLDW